MKKGITMMTLALLCSAGVFMACGHDDEELQPKEQADNTQPSDSQPEQHNTNLYISYNGWSKATVHGTTIKTDEETLAITLNEDSTVNLVYHSPSWGDATLKNVTMTQNEQGYTFEKPINVTMNDEQTAWIFPENVDSIAMVQKGPAAGGTPTAKLYPFVLNSGFVSADLKTYKFTFSAYLSLNGAGIYSMTFKNGPVEEDTPVVQ